jgi:hypothetical protein
MRFWFGLKFLRLIYKKTFLKLLNGFYLIDHSPEKLPWHLIRVGKKLSAKGLSKEAQFCADFTKVHHSCVKHKGKKFTEKLIFKQKSVFRGKKSLNTS